MAQKHWSDFSGQTVLSLRFRAWGSHLQAFFYKLKREKYEPMALGTRYRNEYTQERRQVARLQRAESPDDTDQHQPRNYPREDHHWDWNDRNSRLISAQRRSSTLCQKGWRNWISVQIHDSLRMHAWCHNVTAQANSSADSDELYPPPDGSWTE